jgi:GT2 family glycosyltransferase
MTHNSTDLSICIVTFKARDYLKECLHSIYEHTQQIGFEIIIVDNGSRDGTSEMIRENYPSVMFFENHFNAGFSRPMNQVIQRASGSFLLLLNPDTLLTENNTFEKLVQYIQDRPEIGIVGPKVINPDGTLQKPCRRSEARPWDVFTYFLGLADRYPQDKRFSGYYMGYIDENTTHEVQGVSGSCMLIRRDVIDQIGLLDEAYFAYQEDADYCLRARNAGWKIYYYPEAVIIHFGGRGGSRVRPYRSIWEWHKSYFIYFRKHFARDYFFLFNWFYYFLMFFKLCYSLFKNTLSKTTFSGARKPG